MNSSNLHYDAVIVGAGVIGASLALALSRKTHWRVALVEQGDSLYVGYKRKGDKKQEDKKTYERNQRVTAIGLPAKALLSQINVWQKLGVEQAFPFDNMFVWDENSDGELAFHASDYGVESLGYVVDHFALQTVLQESLAQDPHDKNPHDKNHSTNPQVMNKVTTYYSTVIDKVTFGDENKPARLGLMSTLSEQNTNSKAINLTADWVFAADGVSSTLRSKAAIQTRQHAYQQRGIVARIQTEYSHQNTAWQRFLSTGPLALLPLNNGQCSIVWTLPNANCEKMLELDDDEFASHLASAMQYRLGKIELCSIRQSFPLQSKQAETYLKGNLVLVGDAAHGIHPLAGQGANLGFGDIRTLLDVIGVMSATDSKMRRALRRFERQQKLENYTMDSLMTGLNGIFASDNVLLSSLRRMGLKILNNSGVLKNFLAARVLNR